MKKVMPVAKKLQTAKKRRNPVAKHSHHKSGAGAHKSKKDYNRKDYRHE